ncbi:MAG TPA: anaerobic glycerol-3-phosphate dehydrogenase subunit GlpA, partial [Candidatus Limnocylindrales bacterium]|nr:anaerobic glycerol-3-phosphate dehydrogenase subunit GlpA [Candidatus Limnocylindrales bacterium]
MAGAWDVLVVGGGATGAGILRDLTSRGLRALLIDKGDLGSGTSGRYHGLLHSGGRYVARDLAAANECIRENRVLRRIAAATIEDTGGYFVATPDDPEDYVEGFRSMCAAADVDCEEVAVDWLLEREPALNRGIRRAFRVPDASLEPWALVEANVAAARRRGGEALAYHELVGVDREGDRIVAARVLDVRSGAVERIPVGFVVSAAGAWAGRVAALAGAEIRMSPGKGTMLVFNQRMTDAVINRCHRPGDGDIMVPVGTVAILGTTEIEVEDPDDYEVTRTEVDALLDLGEHLFPDLRSMRLLRAYAGVRPLYDPGESGHSETRTLSRTHVVLDHERRDGVTNFVSIVGGKLTTYRLMAEHTVDAVCAKLGVTAECRTADEPLPGSEDGRFHWLGARFAEHEEQGGGDGDLICECEIVTRDAAAAFLDERWPCSLDDLRRGTRLGMGPCQGGFCTFRAAGMVADRAAAATGSGVPPALGGDDLAAVADRALADFLRERHKGTRPIAYGRQLQEWALTTAIQWGTLGAESLLPVSGAGAAA